MKRRSRRQTVYLAATRVSSRLTAHVDPFCSTLSKVRDGSETVVAAASGRRLGSGWEVEYRGEVADASSCRACGDTDLSVEWQDFAACIGLDDLFFDNAKREEAKLICATCTVRGPCGEYARAIKAPAGVWGGRSFTPGKKGRVKL